MISTLTQAVEAVQRFLDRENFARFGYTPAVVANLAREVPGGFIVPWDTEAYSRTGDVNHRLAGNWPVFVDAASGECRLLAGDDY